MRLVSDRSCRQTKVTAASSVSIVDFDQIGHLLIGAIVAYHILHSSIHEFFDA